MNDPNRPEVFAGLRSMACSSEEIPGVTWQRATAFMRFTGQEQTFPRRGCKISVQKLVVGLRTLFVPMQAAMPISSNAISAIVRRAITATLCDKQEREEATTGEHDADALSTRKGVEIPTGGSAEISFPVFLAF